MRRSKKWIINLNGFNRHKIVVFLARQTPSVALTPPPPSPTWDSREPRVDRPLGLDLSLEADVLGKEEEKKSSESRNNGQKDGFFFSN